MQVECLTLPQIGDKVEVLSAGIRAARAARGWINKGIVTEVKRVDNAFRVLFTAGSQEQWADVGMVQVLDRAVTSFNHIHKFKFQQHTNPMDQYYGA